jgi:hypothetical protein
MTPTRFGLISLYFLYSTFCCSQTVLISPEINIKNDFSYYILSHPNGNTSLLRDKSFKLSLQTLNPEFEWGIERNIEIPGKKWRIIDSYANGNEIGIYLITKEDNQFSIIYSIYNSQAILIKEKILKTGVTLSNNEGVRIEISDDVNWAGISFYNEHNEKELLLYNRIQDSVYYNINIDTLFEKNEIMIREFEISNIGMVYLFGRWNDSNAGKKKQQTMTCQFDLTGKKSANKIITLENGVMINGFAKFDNQNNRLVVAGLYSEKPHQPPKGYVVSFFAGDMSTQSTKYVNFSEEMLIEWTGKNKKSDFSGSELNTRDIAFRKDGGCLIFYENTKELSRRPYFSSSDPTGIYPSRWFDYYFDDIIVASFDNTGKLSWDRVLHKRQYSQDDEGLFSSFYIFRMNALLGIIFNDAISSEGTVSEYLLKPNGDHIRKSILNTSYKNLNLRFQDATVLNAQSLMVPSENNGKLNLVKIVFD